MLTHGLDIKSIIIVSQNETGSNFKNSVKKTRPNLQNLSLVIIRCLVNIYIYLCVCVCVCVRERERERESEREGQTDRNGDENRERAYVCIHFYICLILNAAV